MRGDFNGDAVIDSDSATPPPYTYTTAGNYTIALTVTNAQGLSHTATATVNVTEAVPTVVDFIASPISGTVPLEVSFTNFSSGNIQSYAWDFNGDTVVDSTDANPSAYIYTVEGNYNATLTVVDLSGVPQSKTQLISVLPVPLPDPPVASFVASPISGTSPLAVTFTNTSTGAIVSYEWDFDNDTVVDSTDANPPAFTYTEAGVYTASLTVTDAHNQWTTATATITVSDPPPPPPVASFTATSLSGNTPLVVNFTNTSTGAIVSYAWDFNGDAVVDSTDANPPAYTYTLVGAYTASLTVTDAHNQSTTATATITVSDPPPPPVPSFTATPLSGNAPLVVTFTNTSTGAITTYAWDFDGDTVVDRMDANPPPQTYTTAGTYTVSLSVRDAIGQITTATATITVTEPPPPPPVASFVATPISGTVPLSVTFTNSSTGAITSYAWDFDSDTVVDSTDANPPAYTYTEVGSYTATLTVQGVGGSHSASQVITVEAVPDEGGDDSGEEAPD